MASYGRAFRFGLPGDRNSSTSVESSYAPGGGGSSSISSSGGDDGSGSSGGGTREARPGLGRALDPSLSRGPLLVGPCTAGNYTLAWFEVKQALAQEGLAARVDPTRMGAYAELQDGRYWVGFDTPQTLRMKMCWARARGVSGVMMWDADGDDRGQLLGAVAGAARDPCEGYVPPCCGGEGCGTAWRPTFL